MKEKGVILKTVQVEDSLFCIHIFNNPHTDNKRKDKKTSVLH